MAEHFEKPKKNAKEVVNGLFRKTFEHASHHGRERAPSQSVHILLLEPGL